MSYTIETQIQIDATAERIWAILTNFPAYAGWNPFVRSIEGTLAAGTALKVTVEPEGKKPMSFSPTLLVAEPAKELRWKGKVLVNGIFDGEHHFKIAPRPEGGVVFHHGETFSGLLVPLFWPSLEGPTRRGFASMNHALKQEAEKP